MDISQVMTLAPVIPVIVVDDIDKALPLAEALVAGGLPALEVTLRTPVAIDAIRAMAQVPGAVVGAGTVLNARDLDRAIEAGAQFIVSPGLTEPLGKAAVKSGVPFLPGTANAGDMMRGLDMGLSHFKFFPAMAAGGVPALKAILAPIAQVSICPTGGVTQANAPDWLALPQVKCVGGSWMIRDGVADVQAIRAAAALATA
jgi:2-dehydro-3-deoxyphosphogluconate aldolase / (4S)-4-hydroxy-2-oxoglutarate aldolase